MNAMKCMNAPCIVCPGELTGLRQSPEVQSGVDRVKQFLHERKTEVVTPEVLMCISRVAIRKDESSMDEESVIAEMMKQMTGVCAPLEIKGDNTIWQRFLNTELT